MKENVHSVDGSRRTVHPSGARLCLEEQPNAEHTQQLSPSIHCTVYYDCHFTFCKGHSRHRHTPFHLDLHHHASADNPVTWASFRFPGRNIHVAYTHLSLLHRCPCSVCAWITSLSLLALSPGPHTIYYSMHYKLNLSFHHQKWTLHEDMTLVPSKYYIFDA